jgi:hypothetical protein
MAGSVLIDIPGIGPVEAKNAASEATLQEILKIMRKFDKSTDGGKKSVDGAGGSGGSNSGGGTAGASAGGSKAGKGVALLGQMAMAAGYALAKVDTAAKIVVGTFGGLAVGSTKLIEEFANVGDDLNRAAGIFSKIPVLGTMFSAVAAAATGAVDAYQSSAAAGATFSGSVNEFAGAASAAGMTLKDFGALISKNSFGMGAFGTTAEDGARNFAKTSKALRATSSDLYALGYSSTQINEGLATYGKLMRQQGQQGKMSNDQLAAGAKNYLKELDLLSKATGEDRKTIEARQAAMALDAQFQASMAGLGPKVRDSFMAVTTGVPSALEGFTKDIMANGVATTEENQKIMAMMPQSAAMLAEFNAKTQRGEAITLEERNRLNNLMKAEGTASLKNIKQAGAASAELGPTVKALAAASTINGDALKEGTAQQDEAAKKTDAMNEAIERSKSKLAEFSNGFQMALANSGMLDLLMKAFEFAAGIVMKYVVPLFSVLGESITIIVGSLVDSFGPAISGVGALFDNILLPAIRGFTEFLAVDVIPAVAETFNNLKPTIVAIGEFIMDWVVPAFKTVAGFIMDNLTPIIKVLAVGLAGYGLYIAASTVIGWAHVAMDAARAAASIPVIAGLIALGAAVLAPLSPFLLVAAAVAGVVLIFKKLGGDTQVISDTFKLMGLKVKDWMLTFQHALFSLINKIPGFRGDFDKDLEEISKQQLENQKQRDAVATGITERMANNREAAKTKEDKEREEKKRVIGEKLDKAAHGAKSTGIKQQEEANKKDKDAKDAANTKIDYGANGADLLKQYATASGSGLIKDQKPAATTGAETVKKTIEADGEKKTADAKAAVEKKAADEKKQAEDAKEGTKKPATQESAETLLAELNTKMAQLIKFSAQTTTNTYETFNAAKGLQGNLFKR